MSAIYSCIKQYLIEIFIGLFLHPIPIETLGGLYA